jgi:hypothetical protein
MVLTVKLSSNQLSLHRIYADIICIRCGHAMIVTASISIPDSHSKNAGVNSHMKPNTPPIGSNPTSRVNTANLGESRKNNGVCNITNNKWFDEQLARPLVLLPDEVTKLHDLAIPYFCRALNQDETSVRLRGRWRNVSEFVLQVRALLIIALLKFLTQHVRIASCGSEQEFSCESKFKQRLEELLGVEKDTENHIGQDKNNSAILPPSQIRVILPMIEYVRRERNRYHLKFPCLQAIH